MKSTLILFLIILILVSSSLVQAKEKSHRAYMLSPEEIYKAAQDLALSVDSSDKESIITPSTLVSGSVFYGYIAGLLDAMPDKQDNKVYFECTRKKSNKVIAIRTAILLSKTEFDRSISNENMAGSLYLSILFACDDKNWKEK